MSESTTIKFTRQDCCKSYQFDSRSGEHNLQTKLLKMLSRMINDVQHDDRLGSRVIRHQYCERVRVFGVKLLFQACFCRARQRIIHRHDAVRGFLAKGLKTLQQVAFVSAEPLLQGQGGRSQRADVKLLANGTNYTFDMPVASPEKQRMVKMRHTDTVLWWALHRGAKDKSTRGRLMARCIVTRFSSCTTSLPMNQERQRRHPMPGVDVNTLPLATCVPNWITGSVQESNQTTVDQSMRRSKHVQHYHWQPACQSCHLYFFWELLVEL